MESKSFKRNSLECDRFKKKIDKPIILKYDENGNNTKNEKLKSLAYELKTLKEMMKNKNKNDYLCEAFFTCGISNNNKILLDSENSMASCKHSECSILPSMKAEILESFPKKNQNCVISSTVKFLF
jgi:hypothetical protein